MKRLSDALKIHFRKTASFLNVLQFYFFETHLILGRPLASEKTLQAMMRTHRCGISVFSLNEELRLAAQNSPLIAWVFTPTFYLQSRILIPSPATTENEMSIIPWGVKTLLPAECIKKLEDAELEAFLYSASDNEMPEWIDWFETEDKAASFTNQLLVATKDSQNNAAFGKNLLRPAIPFYIESITEYYKLPKGKQISKALLKADFAPKGQNDIGTAYRIVSESLAKHKKRHFEDFQWFWRARLTDLMFEGLPWDKDQCQVFLAEYFPAGNKIHKTNSVPRWKTSLSIDRQTYGKFIRYFSDRFIADPLKYKVEGEIALLLRISVYASLDLEKSISIKKLLKSTTAHVSGRYVTVDKREIELSWGLADLIKEYVGEGPFQRQQRLFVGRQKK